MDEVPYHYRATVDRSVDMLIHKQYPEDEFVLDDDIIVLTRVDIRVNNIAGETDESDDESRNEFLQVYNVEENFSEQEEDGESDLDDFIDDRPESELSEEYSDNEEREEDQEYDSESEDGSEDNENENEIGSQETENGNASQESESESDNENNNKENDVNNESENKRNISDDDDDEPIKSSPYKKPKLNILRDDDSSDSDGEGGSNNGVEGSDNDGEESNDGTEGSSESSTSHKSSPQVPIASTTSTNVVMNVQQRDENTFGVYLLPRISGIRTCLRYHGRIGMSGIKGYCRPMRTKKKFCDLIARKRNTNGFTRLNLLYVNARHLEYRKPESELPKAVRKLLIHIIDQWFPVGIPLELHLDRAIDLLNCLKKSIKAGKIPSLKHSNKFYELIPHQGDPRRRPRFKDVELCDSKIKYVETMKSAITDCFSEFDRNRNRNPLDYFIEHWLRIELQVLEPNDIAYEILNEVIENTQHKNTERRFSLKNVFKVDNMNPDANGDNSSDIRENHRYLFHFTFASNLPCILREGLLVAPKHIHSVNRFLGDGIYFWDAIANAGLNFKSLNTVYVLVCRVALGKMQQVEQHYLKHGETLEWGQDSDSIFCLGKEFSSARDDEKDLNGAKIYCGQLADKTDWFIQDRYSLYNEYVVRNKNQVIVDYIVKLEKE